jgi:hypothetical protein
MTQRSQCWHLQRVTCNKAFEGLTRSQVYKPWLELFWQQHPPCQLAAALADHNHHPHTHNHKIRWLIHLVMFTTEEYSQDQPGFQLRLLGMQEGHKETRSIPAETFHLHESLCSSHQALLEHCECQCACLFRLKGCMGYPPLTHYMTHYSCSIVQLYFITNSVVRSPHLCVCLIGLIIDIVCIVLRWLPGQETWPATIRDKQMQMKAKDET